MRDDVLVDERLEVVERHLEALHGHGKHGDGDGELAREYYALHGHPLTVVPDVPSLRPARRGCSPRIMLSMPTEPMNILADVTTRAEFRAWLAQHHATERECWVAARRGRPADDAALWYLDAVEEALCIGWVDSVLKVVDGVPLQRFGPRRRNSPWTELNKERVRRLERLGLMTDAGRAVLPAMGPRSFRVDPDVAAALKSARCWSRFRSFPPLYQRVRAYNVAFYKTRDPRAYERALANLIAHTRRGELFGEWNDYGRLLG